MLVFADFSLNATVRTDVKLNFITACFRYVSQRSLSLQNEPILEFKPGSSERAAVEKCLSEIESKTEEVPIMIGDEAVWTDNIKYQACVSFSLQ